jgi:hypothetical protein
MALSQLDGAELPGQRWPGWLPLCIVGLLTALVVLGLGAQVMVPLWEGNEIVAISYTPTEEGISREAIAAELIRRWLTHFEGRWYVSRIEGFSIEEVTVHRLEGDSFLFWATYGVVPDKLPSNWERGASAVSPERIVIEGEFRVYQRGDTYYLWAY